MIHSIIFFIVVTLGLGFSVLYLLKAKRQENALLWLLEIFGVGIATFSFLAVIFDILHVPLHFLIYLILAVIVPIAAIIISLRKKGNSSFAWKWNEETACALVVLIMIAALFLLMHKGAFGYPYLENDDPWNHALGASYIAHEQTYDIDPAAKELSGGYAFYLEPYPPTYDVIMGVLRQTNDSIVWTLKFFNALMIALTLGGFYLMARLLLKTDLKALFATLIFAALPSSMSHFIWSQTLALLIFPIAMYGILKATQDDSWRYPAIIIVASMMVTQPVVSFFFGITVIIMVALIFVHELMTGKKESILKRLPLTSRAFIVAAGGLLLSFLYWGIQMFKWGFDGIFSAKGGEVSGGWASGYALQSYQLREIIFAPHSSRIDQAIGFGWVVALLLLIGIFTIIFAAKRTLNMKSGWLHWHLLIWFTLLAYFVFAPTIGLPGWGSSRAWAYLAIPLALLATEGTFILINSFTKQQRIKIIIVAVLAIGVLSTSVPAKIAVQTAGWPPGAQWNAQEELAGYLQAAQVLPKNSRLYPMCSGDQRSVGFDMQSEPWNKDISMFRKTTANASAEQIITFLRQHQYEYVTFDYACTVEHGANGSLALATQIESLVTAGQLQPLMSQQGFFLAQVR